MAPAFVVYADDAEVLNGSASSDGGFDFAGVDVFAACNNFVTAASDNVEIAFGVNVAEVVGSEGGIGVSVRKVSQHSGACLDDNMSSFVRLAARAEIVLDFDRDVGKGFADAANRMVVAGAEFFGGEGGDLGSGFGHAVGEGDRQVLGSGLLEKAIPGGGAAEEDGFEALEFGLVNEALKLGGDEGKIEGFELDVGEMAVFEFFPVPKDELAPGEVRS